MCEFCALTDLLGSRFFNRDWDRPVLQDGLVGRLFWESSTGEDVFQVVMPKDSFYPESALLLAPDA